MLYEKWQKRFGAPKSLGTQPDWGETSTGQLKIYHVPDYYVQEFLEEEERLYQKESINQISRIAELEREVEELKSDLAGLGEYIN